MDLLHNQGRSTPQYFRERASDMQKQAENASDNYVRSSLLEMAASWTNLAVQAEGSNRWRRVRT